jgi:hypothetical protein
MLADRIRPEGAFGVYIYQNLNSFITLSIISLAFYKSEFFKHLAVSLRRHISTFILRFELES